jgi:hypothetical protein
VSFDSLDDLICFLFIERLLSLPSSRSVEFLIGFIFPLVIQILNFLGPGVGGLSGLRKQLCSIFIDSVFNLFNSSSVSLLNNT